MTIVTEGRHAAEFLISEANGTRSRETVTLITGENLIAGAVLGQITKAGTASAEAFAGNTGNGAMGAIVVGAGAKVGDYKLTIVEPGSNVGTFVVEDPDGNVVGTGVVATEFDQGGLTFTLADGGTDFAAGDGFTITVAEGSGKYKEYDPTNTDGSETAVAILYRAVDATDADKDALVIARDAEVDADDLAWFTGATTNQKAAGAAELALKGIIVRGL